MFGRSKEEASLTGSRSLSWETMSSWTLAVAVAVRAMMGTSGKRDLREPSFL